MRPYLLAAALACAAAVPTANAAGPCAATAEAPTAVDAVVLGSGSFTCALPNAGMTVTVCIESLQPNKTGAWRVEGCDTETAAGSVRTVAANLGVCYLGMPTLVRTTASGRNADGDAATATSLPTWAPGVGSCGP